MTMTPKKTFVSAILFLLCATTFANNTNKVNFVGQWGITIDGGGVGWLHIFDTENYLDAELMWIGGSVTPVSHVYYHDDTTLIITRTHEVKKSDTRKHILTSTLTITLNGDQLTGTMMQPHSDGGGVSYRKFTGNRMPAMPKKPDLSSLKYDKAISLFNGKNLEGWSIINSNDKNGFYVKDGLLSNNPVQPKEGHINYGNLRTDQEFTDFKLSLDVNVPDGHNSGIYLKGLYEVQVMDSYGLPLDSHHMGALYSRITPSVAAEKPAGEWQHVEITLVDRHVTVVLNGTTIINNKPVLGPTGGAISANVLAPGPIYLQGDHGNVSYKNIVLKPIVK